MAIDVIIVKEDLNTPISEDAILESIESNNDFYNLRNFAAQLNLAFISTLDEVGLTIINDLQRYPFEQEIKELRKYPQLNQKVLDILENAVNMANKSSHLYIKFIGD